MSIFTKIFNRFPKGEIAPSLTIWERQSAELNTTSTSGLPYETYSLMEKDSMIQTALNVKRLGVLAAPYEVIPADSSLEAQQKADFVLDAFARLQGSVNTVLLSAMEAFSKGWSVQECVYEQSDGRIWLTAVRAKDPSLFGLILDEYGRLSGLKLHMPGQNAVTLPLGRFVVYRHGLSYSRPKGRSDLDAAYPHYLAKQSLLNAWRSHLEKFASPTVLGRFGRNLNSSDRTDLQRALNRLPKIGSILFPDDVQITTIGGQSDASTGYLDAIAFHNREIARAIIGQTLTTDEGSRIGSLALGRVHLQVLLLQLQALRKELADTVMTEQIIRPLVELNFGPGQIPRFVFSKGSTPAFTEGILP